MIIYNVTINVEDQIHSDWLNWMKEVHIPDVMNTGCFIDNKICKVLSVQQDEQGHTYAIQYTCENEIQLNKYQEEFASKLQKEHLDKYNGKFVAFRTILKVV